MSARTVLEQTAEMQRAVDARMARIRTKVAIFSGKGGVGKSTVAASLALALKESGAAVGLVDADLASPALSLIFGFGGTGLRAVGDAVLPWRDKLGIPVFSVGAESAGPDDAAGWQGPAGTVAAWRGVAARSVLREILTDVEWGELDFIIFDLPPGTDALEDLAQLLGGLDLSLAITTESALAWSAVDRSIRRANHVGIEVAGLVVNMSSPRANGTDVIDLIRNSPRNIEVASRIPMDHDFAMRLESGDPASVLVQPTEAVRAIRELAGWLVAKTSRSGGSSKAETR